MPNPRPDPMRHPLRVWVIGLLIGVIAGAASIYVIARPAVDGTIAGTIAPAR